MDVCLIVDFIDLMEMEISPESFEYCALESLVDTGAPWTDL